MTTTRALRLYYTDADVRAFDAVVRSCDLVGDRFHVRLDRTAFYPTSGGQPFDTGRLSASLVVDVIDDEDAGDIAHVVTAPLPVGAGVRGEIDAARRADHMQQHTGQHVLSAAFDRVSGVPTVSFHMGADVSTIDLARDVTAVEIETAETEANRVVWDDRPVTVRFVSSEEAASLPLRKPPTRAGEIRLVDVADFDLSACGGTHVASTGRIGIVAVTGWERFKGGTRVSFVCGRRALDSHRRLRDVVASAGRVLSTGAAEIVPQIERLQQDARERGRLLADAQTELAGHRARAWREAAETIGPHRVVLRTDPSADGASLKTMAQAIVAEPGLVAVLIGGGQPTPIVVARSADVSFDAGVLVRAVTTTLGGRGGGRAELAQAGVAAASDRIVAFVRHALGA
jgi:alanyl-tRNA synthetase